MYTTKSKQESIDTINYMLSEYGMKPMTEKDVIDWGIEGGETIAQLQEWVNDYASEEHTERCAAKHRIEY